MWREPRVYQYAERPGAANFPGKRVRFLWALTQRGGWGLR